MDLNSFQTQLGDGPLTSGTVASAVQKAIDKQAAAKTVAPVANPFKAVPAPTTPAPAPVPGEAQGGEVPPPAVAKTPEELEKDKITERFGALARLEAQNVRIKQDIAREKQAIAAERAKLEAQGTEFAGLKAKVEEENILWAKNPLEALRRKGFTYDQLTQLQLNEGRPTPEMVAKQTVEEILAEERKKAKEAEESEKSKLTKVEQERFEQTLANFRQEVQDFYTASENTEAYELINLHDAGEVVVATIEEHFQRTKKAAEVALQAAIESGDERAIARARARKPEIMGIKQSCDLVEKFLEERVEKSTQTKKWASKVNPAPADGASQPNREATPTPTNVQPRTINNNLTSSAQGSRPLSRDERIKRAMAVQVVALPK